MKIKRSTHQKPAISENARCARVAKPKVKLRFFAFNHFVMKVYLKIIQHIRNDFRQSNSAKLSDKVKGETTPSKMKAKILRLTEKSI